MSLEQLGAVKTTRLQFVRTAPCLDDVSKASARRRRPTTHTVSSAQHHVSFGPRRPPLPSNHAQVVRATPYIVQAAAAPAPAPYPGAAPALSAASSSSSASAAEDAMLARAVRAGRMMLQPAIAHSKRDLQHAMLAL